MMVAAREIVGWSQQAPSTFLVRHALIASTDILPSVYQMQSDDPWSRADWRSLSAGAAVAPRDRTSGVYATSASPASYHVAHQQSHAHVASPAARRVTPGAWPFPAKPFRPSPPSADGGSASARTKQRKARLRPPSATRALTAGGSSRDSHMYGGGDLQLLEAHTQAYMQERGSFSFDAHPPPAPHGSARHHRGAPPVAPPMLPVVSHEAQAHDLWPGEWNVSPSPLSSESAAPLLAPAPPPRPPPQPAPHSLHASYSSMPLSAAAGGATPTPRVLRPASAPPARIDEYATMPSPPASLRETARPSVADLLSQRRHAQTGPPQPQTHSTNQTPTSIPSPQLVHPPGHALTHEEKEDVFGSEAQPPLSRHEQMYSALLRQSQPHPDAQVQSYASVSAPVASPSPRMPSSRSRIGDPWSAAYMERLTAKHEMGASEAAFFVRSSAALSRAAAGGSNAAANMHTTRARVSRREGWWQPEPPSASLREGGGNAAGIAWIAPTPLPQTIRADAASARAKREFRPSPAFARQAWRDNTAHNQPTTRTNSARVDTQSEWATQAQMVTPVTPAQVQSQNLAASYDWQHEQQQQQPFSHDSSALLSSSPPPPAPASNFALRDAVLAHFSHAPSLLFMGSVDASMSSYLVSACADASPEDVLPLLWALETTATTPFATWRDLVACVAAQHADARHAAVRARQAVERVLASEQAGGLLPPEEWGTWGPSQHTLERILRAAAGPRGSDRARDAICHLRALAEESSSPPSSDESQVVSPFSSLEQLLHALEARRQHAANVVRETATWLADHTRCTLFKPELYAPPPLNQVAALYFGGSDRVETLPHLLQRFNDDVAAGRAPHLRDMQELAQRIAQERGQMDSTPSLHVPTESARVQQYASSPSPTPAPALHQPYQSPHPHHVQPHPYQSVAFYQPPSPFSPPPSQSRGGAMPYSPPVAPPPPADHSHAFAFPPVIRDVDDDDEDDDDDEEASLAVALMKQASHSDSRAPRTTASASPAAQLDVISQPRGDEQRIGPEERGANNSGAKSVPMENPVRPAADMPVSIPSASPTLTAGPVPAPAPAPAQIEALVPTRDTTPSSTLPAAVIGPSRASALLVESDSSDEDEEADRAREAQARRELEAKWAAEAAAATIVASADKLKAAMTPTLLADEQTTASLAPNLAPTQAPVPSSSSSSEQLDAKPSVAPSPPLAETPRAANSIPPPPVTGSTVDPRPTDLTPSPRSESVVRFADTDDVQQAATPILTPTSSGSASSPTTSLTSILKKDTSPLLSSFAPVSSPKPASSPTESPLSSPRLGPSSSLARLASLSKARAAATATNEAQTTAVPTASPSEPTLQRTSSTNDSADTGTPTVSMVTATLPSPRTTSEPSTADTSFAPAVGGAPLPTVAEAIEPDALSPATAIAIPTAPTGDVPPIKAATAGSISSIDSSGLPPLPPGPLAGLPLAPTVDSTPPTPSSTTTPLSRGTASPLLLSPRISPSLLSRALTPLRMPAGGASSSAAASPTSASRNPTSSPSANTSTTNAAQPVESPTPTICATKEPAKESSSVPLTSPPPPSLSAASSSDAFDDDSACELCFERLARVECEECGLRLCTRGPDGVEGGCDADLHRAPHRAKHVRAEWSVELEAAAEAAARNRAAATPLPPSAPASAAASRRTTAVIPPLPLAGLLSPVRSNLVTLPISGGSASRRTSLGLSLGVSPIGSLSVTPITSPGPSNRSSLAAGAAAALAGTVAAAMGGATPVRPASTASAAAPTPVSTSSSPLCDICDEDHSTVFCSACRMHLCAEDDAQIHRPANKQGHARTPL